MTCTEHRRWLSPYVDKQLSPPERAQLEEHLASCTGCRTELESLQQMLQSLRAMEPPQAPDLLPGIHAQLQREPWWSSLAERFTAPWPISLPLHGLALAATALLVVVVAGLPSLSRQKHELVLSSSKGERRAFQGAPSARAAASYERSDYDDVGGKKEPKNQRFAEVLRDKEKVVAREDAASVLQSTASAGLAGAPMEADAVQTAKAMPARALDAIEEQPVENEAPAAPAKSAGVAYNQAVGQELKSLGAALSAIQATWRVQDVAAATAQVIEWVRVRQGTVVMTDERHLSVTLPASDVPSFLAQFSTPPVSAPIPSDAPQLTISLEIILSQ